ncbi:MAG TPA: hypothetical protein VJ804_14410 [Acidimicrobiales bacterium]|nr:hypothetical protein [Acidimicrobiales bacterium]
MLEAVHHRLSLTARLVAVTAVLLVADASPAMADPAGPGDFRSEVTGIVPAVDGVEAEVQGGDAFLELRVDEGHSVVVEGYSGEPYLRFREDGTVERNRRSPATYVNDDREGQGDIPPDATADAEPSWEEVADGGTYAWHDHRIHWMQDASPSVPRGSRVGGVYDPWQVPIEVDGTATNIRGTLTYEDSTSPLPWIAVGLVVAGALAWLGRGRATMAAPAALTVISVAAVVVGRADFAASPGGGDALLWILPVVALVAAVVGLVPATTRFALVGTLASVASLSGWALFRIDVLTEPVLPTPLPFALDRATTTVALGVAVAAAYLALASGALKLPDLPDD